MSERKHRDSLRCLPSRRGLAELLERGDVESAVRAEKGTVAEFINAWAARKANVPAKSRQQYDWAAGHIRKSLGGIPLGQLTREDVATEIDDMATGGQYAHRSVQIFRMVLRAALDEAVAEGRRRRSPAARVGMPRQVLKPTGSARCRHGPRTTSASSWAIKDHRWYGPIRLDVLYGLRRSELLGSKRGDIDLKAGIVRIERGLTEVRGRPTWTDGKNARSRRTIPIDPTIAPAPRRAPAPPGLGAARRRQHVGLQRPRRGEPDRHRRLTRQVRPDPRAPRAPSRRTTADIARPPPHGRDAHGPPRQRQRRDPRRCRPARPQPRHAQRTYAHALPESARTVTDNIAQRGADV